MPNETFFNLKNEKKNKITEVAIKELSEFGLENASVNRIVKAAGIATGSFYQYFEDLDDLIVFIMIHVSNNKIKYIQEDLDKVEDKKIENYIKAMYKGGIRFALENEDACKIANYFMNIKNTPLFNKIIKVVPRSNLNNSFIPLIENSIKNGEIREDMTIELFMLLLVNINLTIIDYIASLKENKSFDFTEENLEKFSDLSVSLLLNAIK